MTGDSDYRFGAFELLARRQLLLRAGATVRIGSRALAILTALVEGAGDLVTKEKLTAAAWPSTFVDDSNLKVNIANLRRALAASDPGQDYIATVPGRGYRFVAPVHRIRTGTRGLPSKIPLIGRADDLATVQGWLSEGPLVTVVGTGGIGKTAFATAAAHATAANYPDGVSFVDLSKISAAEFISVALLFSLELRTSGEDPLTEIIHALEGQRKLLLIDNCEHLLPSVAGVIDRLTTSLQGVRILATSREPLRIRNERVYRLGPLRTDPRVSPTASQAWAYPAVELFVTRASEHTGYKWCDADAPSTAEICRRLDGIPLAIELAATRIGALTPTELLEVLDDRLTISACGSHKAPLRQQTLHATLDWSYNLLSDTEAACARALSVFAGAFPAEGVIAVASNDTAPETIINILSSLAAKSFLVIDCQESAVSYHLLETTRAYLLERLQLAGEENEAKHRHAKFMCALLGCAGNPSVTGAVPEWRAKFGGCLDDVRSALAWTLSSDEDAALGIRLAVVALPLLSELSLHDECRETAERVLLGAAMGSTYVPEGDDANAWESALQAARANGAADPMARVLGGLARCEMLTVRKSGRVRKEGELLLAMGETYRARLPNAFARPSAVSETAS